MKSLPRILVLALSFCTAPAAWSQAFDKLIVDVSESAVIPMHQAQVAMGKRLRSAAEAFCESPDGEGLAALRDAYHGMADSYQPLQAMQIGPSSFALRASRAYFWPDDRNTTGRHLASLIASGDAGRLQPDRFREDSVAVQGLPALERLIFGDKVLESFQTEPFRCRIVLAIAANLHAMAQNTVAGWYEGDLPYLDVMRTAADGNAFYYDAAEAAADYLKLLHAQLEFVVVRKLDAVLGESAEQSKPRLADGWRSERVWRNIRLNLEGARRVYLGGEDYGFDDALAEAEGGKALDENIQAGFQSCIAQAGELEGEPHTVVLQTDRREAVVSLRRCVNELREIIAHDLTAAVGLPLGFNALDGD